MPSIHTSLLTAVPACVGQTLPGGAGPTAPTEPRGPGSAA